MHRKLDTNYRVASCAEVEEMTQRTHECGYFCLKTTEGRGPTLHRDPQYSESSVWESLAHLRQLVQMKGTLPVANRLSGLQVHWPRLTLKYFLTSADPPSGRCPDLSVSEREHYPAQLSCTTLRSPKDQSHDSARQYMPHGHRQGQHTGDVSVAPNHTYTPWRHWKALP